MGKRNGLIDFYRFIFSLVIVFHHAMWLDGVVDISTIVVRKVMKLEKELGTKLLIE